MLLRVAFCICIMIDVVACYLSLESFSYNRLIEQTFQSLENVKGRIQLIFLFTTPPIEQQRKNQDYDFD
jgi:hypothetical protein